MALVTIAQSHFSELEAYWRRHHIDYSALVRWIAIRDVAAEKTELGPDQLRELLDPLELTKGGIKG